MLLALDAGNTNITIGIFKNGELMDHRRLRTVRDQTSDEWGILLMSLLRFAGLDPKALDGIISMHLLENDPVLSKPLTDNASADDPGAGDWFVLIDGTDVNAISAAIAAQIGRAHV